MRPLRFDSQCDGAPQGGVRAGKPYDLAGLLAERKHMWYFKAGVDLGMLAQPIDVLGPPRW